MEQSAKMSATVADALGEYVAGVRFTDLSPTAVKAAKLHLLDTLAVMIAATTDPVTDVLRRWSSRLPTGPVHTLTGSRLVAHDAAFVHSTMMHALDFDDMAFGGHSSSSVLGGVLALAESTGVEGREIITSYVVGLELFALMEEFDESAGPAAAGWHATSVRAMVAAVAGAASAANCTPPQATAALTVNLSTGAATVGSFGSMVKPTHAGLVAQNAVRSTELALAGLSGRPEAFDGAGGFGQVYFGGELDWHGLVNALGRTSHLERGGPTVKQYPSCAGNQRAMTTIRRIMDNRALTHADIAAVELHVDPELRHLLIIDWPTNRYEAKFSLLFNAATALLGRQDDLGFYEAEEYTAPELTGVRDRLVVRYDRPGLGHVAQVEIITRDGRRFRGEDMVLPGSPQSPFTVDQVRSKFLRCAAGRVPEPAASTLFETVLHLDQTAARQFWTLWTDLSECAIH